MEQPEKIPQRYLSHKELAAKYGIHRDTLKKEVKKIPGINLKKFQALYSPSQLKIIFKHLGNPYETT